MSYNACPVFLKQRGFSEQRIFVPDGNQCFEVIRFSSDKIGQRSRVSLEILLCFAVNVIRNYENIAEWETVRRKNHLSPDCARQIFIHSSRTSGMVKRFRTVPFTLYDARNHSVFSSVERLYVIGTIVYPKGSVIPVPVALNLFSSNKSRTINSNALGSSVPKATVPVMSINIPSVVVSLALSRTSSSSL